MRISTAIVAAMALIFTSCTKEAATPIDLDAPTTSITAPDLSGDDPNAAARRQIEDLARQQCLDDPTAEMGVIVLADPDTGEEVNRFELPCDELVD